MTCQADMEGEKLRKGPWLEEEDERLTGYVNLNGNRRWDALAKESGLRRSGRSCRMRWLNYLRPNLKHGRITVEEEKIILHLHERWGNKWSTIARMLPGRTDNEIKNYWRTYLKKKEPIQDGNFQCTSNKGQQSLFFQEGDMSAEKQYNFNQHHDSVSNLCGAKDACSDDLGLSEFALTNSPYETRLSDWISELSSEQSGINYNQDCNSVESDLCHPTWTPDDSNRWECPSFLWDMN
ncbi:PREDICTED: mRNAion [Prunus dulcis]|uniref:PREDICTED: mRNAion n=1 Tax=Prunus dulcis TaxID=3755 RepID=A0A5E4E120_PRUDU|nr:transcription factor MYB27 [Prunus dulcis]VVA09433.1 PREDICTED: mRNAion [Prunus dulcis]